MLFWGLLVAKAKAGISSASNKDSQEVNASWKKIVKILVVVALTTFVQMKYEPKATNQLQSYQAGRNLRATAAVDYETVL